MLARRRKISGELFQIAGIVAQRVRRGVLQHAGRRDSARSAVPHSSSGMRVQVLLERSQRSAANFRVPQLAIARRIFELRQQIEGDVRGLIMRRIGARTHTRTAIRWRFRAGRRVRGSPAASSRAPQSGNQSRGDRFHVSLDARNLSGEETCSGCVRNCSVGVSSAGPLI